MSKAREGTPPPADYGHGASGKSVSNEAYPSVTEFADVETAGNPGFGSDKDAATAEAEAAMREFEKENPGAQG